jgi:hypothetical protein
MAAARRRGPTQTAASDKPRSDVYTGLLALALVAMLAASALLYLDFSLYPQKKPPRPQAPPAPADVKPTPK